MTHVNRKVAAGRPMFKYWRTAEKGWWSSLGVGRRVKKYSRTPLIRINWDS